MISNDSIAFVLKNGKALGSNRSPLSTAYTPHVLRLTLSASGEALRLAGERTGIPYHVML
jgi:hypothetical protein